MVGFEKKMGPKEFLAEKNVWSKRVGVTKMFWSIKFRVKIIFGQKKCCQKNIWFKKVLGQKKFLL